MLFGQILPKNLGVHLEPADCFKRISVVGDLRLATIRRPANGEDIEPSRVIQQPVVLKKMQSQVA
jgi:hypothetical protein